VNNAVNPHVEAEIRVGGDYTLGEDPENRGAVVGLSQRGFQRGKRTVEEEGENSDKLSKIGPPAE